MIGLFGAECAIFHLLFVFYFYFKFNLFLVYLSIWLSVCLFYLNQWIHKNQITYHIIGLASFIRIWIAFFRYTWQCFTGDCVIIWAWCIHFNGGRFIVLIRSFWMIVEEEERKKKQRQMCLNISIYKIFMWKMMWKFRTCTRIHSNSDTQVIEMMWKVKENENWKATGPQK